MRGRGEQNSSYPGLDPSAYVNTPVREPVKSFPSKAEVADCQGFLLCPKMREECILSSCSAMFCLFLAPERCMCVHVCV